jgi:photosystem II stability/assembly factor-like uncharacterized protein
MRLHIPTLAIALLATPVSAADWQPVTTDLLKKEKPGYGGLCGVAVGRDGTVFANVSDRGVFRSGDQGKTWARLGGEIKGRTETAGCLQLDPTGKTNRIVMATVYGGPIVVGNTETGDWRALEGKSRHVDWCVVDWTDREPTYILALKHESGGVLLSSRDGGKTFEGLDAGWGPAWVFDEHTAVMTMARPKGRLFRTTDGGQSIKANGDYGPVALPHWFDGALYWLADGQLIKTTDAAKTWQKVCDLKDGRYGPVFGKDAKHLFVLTGTGIVETADGGTTWTKPIPLPPELKGVNPLTWLAYDPKNDILYVMKMTTELYKTERR